MSGLADLHRHLDGSLRPATVAALAAAADLPVPADLAFFPGMGLGAALQRFSFTLSLLRAPEAVHRVASEICEDAAADGVTTLELRFAPQLHGPPIPEVIAAAVEGIAGRAGLLLCGLYGEPPSVLELLLDAARDNPGVTGVDLAGGPSSGDDWSMLDYAPAFTRAQAMGLGRTVHAGEGRPPGEIRVAIEQLHAQRVGHGTTLLDDASVVDLVLERGVTIEACPTSNWQVGVIPEVASHPLPRWLALGIRACVCTDNTLLSAVTASQELARAAAMPGMDDSLVAALTAAGHAAAFPRRS